MLCGLRCGHGSSTNSITLQRNKAAALCIAKRLGTEMFFAFIQCLTVADAAPRSYAACSNVLPCLIRYSLSRATKFGRLAHLSISTTQFRISEFSWGCLSIGALSRNCKIHYGSVTIVTQPSLTQAQERAPRWGPLPSISRVSLFDGCLTGCHLMHAEGFLMNSANIPLTWESRAQATLTG